MTPRKEPIPDKSHSLEILFESEEEIESFLKEAVQNGTMSWVDAGRILEYWTLGYMNEGDMSITLNFVAGKLTDFGEATLDN